MTLFELNQNAKHYNKIKEIYLYSFPENERLDFEDLVNRKLPNSNLLGIFDNDTLIGFSFISTISDFAYIVYLAIDKEQRNKNYGTQALRELCNKYKDKTKVLCVEKPNSQDDMQTRRIGFYKRNGFTLANFEFDYLGQSYYSMYNGVFNKQKFMDFLLVCFPGCKNFRKIKGIYGI